MKLIIILLTLFSITFISCQREKNETSQNYIGNNPNNRPPPPTQQQIEEAYKTMPSPAETIKTIRDDGKLKGLSEKEINEIVESYKQNYKEGCGSCFEQIKNL